MNGLDDRECMEVEQQSKLQSGETQIRNQLCAMNFGQPLRGLQLNDDRALDDEICAVHDSYVMALVLAANRHFALIHQTPIRQFDRECCRVRTLEKADAQDPLNLYF